MQLFTHKSANFLHETNQERCYYKLKLYKYKLIINFPFLKAMGQFIWR